MNYSELVDAIKQYAEADDPDFVATIPTFVRNAEERIYSEVQLTQLRRNVEGTLVTGNQYMTLPRDFLSPYSLAVKLDDGSYHYLLNKDVSFIREAYPNPNDLGTPRFYALFGPATDCNDPPDLVSQYTCLLGPTPDSSYKVELHYFFHPVSIVDAGESWLGEHFPNVLLYGALREAAVFQRQEEDVVKNIEDKYTEAMALLKKLGDGKQRQDMYRTGQVRYPVT